MLAAYIIVQVGRIGSGTGCIAAASFLCCPLMPAG